LPESPEAGRTAAPVRLRGAVVGFLLLTGGYVGLLVWADARTPLFASIRGLLPLLPAMIAMSAFAYLARYLRWRRLLARAGHATGFGRGLLAYLSGFAFTATPGKVGELVRMRYLVPLGVPAPSRVPAPSSSSVRSTCWWCWAWRCWRSATPG